MNATINMQEIQYGNQSYRVGRNGNWQALMWGSYMDTPNKGLYWRWMPIPSDKVPQAVKDQARIN